MHLLRQCRTDADTDTDTHDFLAPLPVLRKLEVFSFLCKCISIPLHAAFSSVRVFLY